MDVSALQDVGRALRGPSGVPALDPAADALAQALRPSYARARALHARMAAGEVDLDGRSAAAVLREERRGHGGTRWQCAECHRIGTVHGPGDACTSCGYRHDSHGRGQHRAVSVA